MASEIEVYWEYGSGSPTSVQLLPYTSGTYGSRQLVNPTDFGVAEMDRWLQPVPFGPGQLERGYVFSKPRRITLTIHIIAGSERKAWAEWEDFNSHFRPDREGKLRLKYYEESGPTQRDRYLLCRRVAVPTVSWPGRHTMLGSYDGGQLRMRMELEATYPHWLDYADDTDSVSISTTPQNVSIDNPGDFPVGLKMTLASLSGSWTSITIQNATTIPAPYPNTADDTVTWSHGSGFSGGDYLDWRHTLPYVVEVTDGVISATGNLALWPGTNSVVVTGAGGTSGTGNLEWAGAFS